MIQVTPIYAGLLALLLVFLSVRVIRARRAARIALGDGGDRALLRRMRVQANFAEYAPLVLVLMAMAELQGAIPVLIHAIGLLLIIGRLCHAYGVSQEPETFRFRVGGMALTFAALVSGALVNLGIGPLRSALAG